MTVPITPETKVGALLEAYPELERHLIELAPAFAKLKNPVLRRTVAKVTTLAQAARVAGLNPRELVVKLRDAAGQQGADVAPGMADDASPATNPWLESLRVVARLDADRLIADGGHPLQAVNARLPSLGEDEAIALVTTFIPAPLIDAVTARGFACTSRTTDGTTETLIGHRRRGG